MRGVALAQRRLLWRVRRKLIISYIFIGFVPAILMVAFFLLGGVLLFSNFSSYLVQTRLRALAERARVDRQDDRARDPARRRPRRGRRFVGAARVAATREFPGASIAVVADAPAVQRAAGGSRRRPRPAATGAAADGDRRPVGACRAAGGRARTGSAATASTGCWRIASSRRRRPRRAGHRRAGSRSAARTCRSAIDPRPRYMLIRALAFPDRAQPELRRRSSTCRSSGQVRAAAPRRDRRRADARRRRLVDASVEPLPARPDYAPPVDADAATAALPLPSFMHVSSTATGRPG